MWPSDSAGGGATITFSLLRILRTHPPSIMFSLRATTLLMSDTRVTRKIKIPYGEPIFANVIDGDYFWRDTSSYVATLAENEVKHQLFLRPPRFGKSFNLSMLQYYLDVNHKARWDALFGKTEIYAGKDVLKHNSKYHCMALDFSVDVEDGSHAAVVAQFRENISQSVVDFCERYSLPPPRDDIAPIEDLKQAVKRVVNKGGKVFVLVDEYDRFANTLMFEHREMYAKIVSGKSGDAQSSPIRSFFEALKSVDARSFTTGITPIALADASGANMIKNLTHDPAFGAMCGFREQDVKRGLQGVLGESHEALDRVLGLMRYYYDGYRFRSLLGPSWLTEPLYNTQLCLYFFSQLQRDPLFSDTVINVWSKDPASADTKKLTDTNVRISENVTHFLAKHPSLPLIQASLVGGRSLQATVEGSVRLRELLEYSGPESVDRLACFLFHHGLVTLKTPGEIVVPNRLVEDPKKGLLAHLEEVLKSRKINLRGVLATPSAGRVWMLFNTLLSALGTRFDHAFSEGAVVSCLEAALHELLVGSINILLYPVVNAPI